MNKLLMYLMAMPISMFVGIMGGFVVINIACFMFAIPIWIIKGIWEVGCNGEVWNRMSIIVGIILGFAIARELVKGK